MIARILALAVLLLAESPTWSGYRARIQTSPFDQATARGITRAGIAGLLAAIALAWCVPSARIPSALAWAGVALTLVGASLRVWSILTLGRFFTLTLQTNAAQRLVELGPYRRIRHPSYLGGELALLGLGLAFGNALSAAALVVPMVFAHLLRIRAEEQMMSQAFGSTWQAYERRTWRLVPFVF